MAFYHLHDLSELNIAFIAWSLIVLIYSLFGRILKTKLFLTSSVFAILVGMIFSLITGLVNGGRTINSNIDLLFYVAAIGAQIQLFLTAIYLPKHYIWLRRRELGILLFITKPLMVAFGFAFAVLFFYKNFPVNLLEYWLLSSILAITDPVLLSDYFKGRFAVKHLPIELSYLLLAEAALNDSFGLLYIGLPVSFRVLSDQSFMIVLLRYFLHVIVWKYILGGFIGGLLGYFGARLLAFSERRILFDKQSFLTYTVALTVFVGSLTLIINTNTFFSVFVSGMVFNWFSSHLNRQIETHYQDTIDSLLNFTFFLIFGLYIPWTEFGNIGVVMLLLFSASLVFIRRIVATFFPIFFARRNGLFHFFSKWDLSFVGFFAPIGTTSLWYTIWALNQFNQELPIFEITVFVILFCVFLFGIVSTPFIFLYYKILHPDVTQINSEITLIKLRQSEDNDLRQLERIKYLREIQHLSEQEHSELKQLRRDRELTGKAEDIEIMDDSEVQQFDDKMYHPRT
ncbi:hypothetical protein RCL1_001811 [Eukaryota sp. TZLM3-RCL]